MSEHRFLRRLSLAGILLLTLVFGWHLGRQYEMRTLYGAISAVPDGSGAVLENPEKEADLSVLWQTWRLLNQYYIEPEKLQSNTLIMGAAQGLTRAAGDPYTVFMTPKEGAQFRQAMEGALDGIGAELTMEDGIVEIVAPLKGSPAEKAGLLPGDAIAEVNDESIAQLTLDEVISRIRGQKGTTVTLTIYREDANGPQKISIVRDHITIPSVEAKIEEHSGKQIGVLSISQFGDNTISEVRKELQNFHAKNADGIVIDLRFNGGGYLDGAVDLVSMFQEEGRVVTVARRGTADEHIDVTGNASFPTIPLVVIINESSASASEIAAGALQDSGRATIVGMPSFGKGTVQDLLPVGDGASLKVTVAHWLTPKGKNLAKEGIEPDVRVDRTAEDYKAGKDPQMEAALGEITGGAAER